MDLTTPLTEAEFDQLDDYLMSDETMGTTMLDSYLAAVSSGGR